jgi:hypothetical protein
MQGRGPLAGSVDEDFGPRFMIVWFLLDMGSILSIS